MPEMIDNTQSQPLVIQDFSIVLAIRNNNPGILTPDFLKGSGMIPADWELATNPLVTARNTQISFTNGIRIESQPGTISFFEGIENDEVQDLQIPSLVRHYATVLLPNLEYQGIGINPRRFVTFGNRADAANDYITGTVLGQGAWKNFGKAPVQAGVNLVYTLDNCQLRLSLNEVKLQIANQETIPAVVFAGNFHYGLADLPAQERTAIINQALDNWQNSLNTYRNLIETQFLSQTVEENIPVLQVASV